MAEVDDAVIDVVASEVVNGCTITGDSDFSDKAADPTSVEMRVKRKAKRLAKSLSRDSGIVNGHGGTATVVQLKRRWKNNRKSRNGFTKRGDIKKGNLVVFLIFFFLICVLRVMLLFENHVLVGCVSTFVFVALNKVYLTVDTTAVARPGIFIGWGCKCVTKDDTFFLNSLGVQ